MQTKVVTISDGDSLSTVEDIMTLGHSRHIPVVRRGALVGVVSERDLLRISLSKLNAHGNSERRAFLHSIEIKGVMSAPAKVIDPESTVMEAARLMAEYKFGCLPVVEGEKLVGLVTDTDVLRYFAEESDLGDRASGHLQFPENSTD